MTPTLPEEADVWADRLRDRLNERDSFRAAAEGFDTVLRFEIRPDRRYDGDAIHVTVAVQDAECIATRTEFGDGTDVDYDFALRGPYAAWKALLQDDLDVIDAVMGGQFRLEGSRIELMSNRDAVTELVRGARTVDAEFAY
jgi:putative sterol carrier protein